MDSTNVISIYKANNRILVDMTYTISIYIENICHIKLHIYFRCLFLPTIDPSTLTHLHHPVYGFLYCSYLMWLLCDIWYIRGIHRLLCMIYGTCPLWCRSALCVHIWIRCIQYLVEFGKYNYYCESRQLAASKYFECFISEPNVQSA